MTHYSLAFLLLIGSVPASAEWTWGDTGSFLLGAAIPIIAHEAGHQLAGGDNIQWSGTEWRCVSSCNGARIAGGGFVLEAAVSEAVARGFNAPSQRAFRIGVRSSAGLHMLTYALRNNSDFSNFSKSDRGKARSLVAVIGLLNLIQISGEF